MATYSSSNMHATTNIAQQTPNMPDLKSSMRATGTAKKSKTVAFTRFGPNVRVIPDYMGTWAIGEESLTATPWEEANVDRLWRKSYAQASAMEKVDAASASAGPSEDYFTKHAPSSSNTGPRIYRPATPVALKFSQPTPQSSFETQTPALPPRPTTTTHRPLPITRKPLRARFHTSPHQPQVQPQQRVDSLHHPSQSPSPSPPSTTFTRPPLTSSRSAHNFSDFLTKHEEGNEHTDLEGRMDTFHPFELFAKMTLKRAKKEAEKIRKVAEQKLAEKKY